jgi:hypothetical protein
VVETRSGCSVGGFASERDAEEALERELERLRRERRVSRSLTVAELVDIYLAQHDVEPVTIENPRRFCVSDFDRLDVGQFRSQARRGAARPNQIGRGPFGVSRLDSWCG